MLVFTSNIVLELFTYFENLYLSIHLQKDAFVPLFLKTDIEAVIVLLHWTHLLTNTLQGEQ